MKPVPCRIEPQFVERIWGARSLAPLFPARSHLPQPIGEVWLSGNDCLVADGPLAGRRLADAWRDMPVSWAGTAMDTRGPFPLLAKFLFPSQWLSVQVHPGDEFAREHEGASGGLGKTEMWHAIHASPGASVLAGLKAGVGAEEFRCRIGDGTVEECLERIPVSVGDNIFIPAGTVHTIGPGLVLCEIQENSDLTYRVFDYHRVQSDGTARALHVEKALAVTRFGEQVGGKTQAVQRERSGRTVTLCAACKYFATERWDMTGYVHRATTPDRFELLIFLTGAGRLEVPEQPMRHYAAGQLWFLPARLGAYQLAPTEATALLRTFVPDLDAVERSLAASGSIPPRLIFK
jgi:mannose-6-phosphate isomerase